MDHPQRISMIMEEDQRIQKSEHVSLKQLKDTIPPKCFESSVRTSISYLARDIIYLTTLVYLASKIYLLPSSSLRFVAWTLYSFLQGCVGTGIWILGHECGHGSFSKHGKFNDFVGWLLHCFLLVPYFAWKTTHARHHRYTGHMTKDVVFVPKILEDIRTDDKTRLELLLDLAEDSPVVTLARLMRHQLIGWQLYLFFNVTAGKDSLPNGRKLATKADMTHFTISSRLFLPSQQLYILLSDVGILFTLVALYFAAKHNGLATMMLLYFAPYLWVHHWIVAITYLHHTHPDVPHYTAATWTFTQGALGTIDRSFGFIGRHFFHEIIDYHLIHHLFPKIPFYHAEEATKAVMPLLGSTYVDAKQDWFLWSLYTTFRSCRFVTAEPQSKDSAASGKLVWATLVK